MSHTDFEIKSGSTAPALEVQLLDGATPLNLTGATVTMRMRRRESGDLTVTDGPVDIVGDPVDGWVKYEWQPADTAEHGTFYVQWKVVFSGGGIQYFPTRGFTIVEITFDLESHTHALPPLPDNCWPVDDSVCDTLHGYPPDIALRATTLAGQTLRLLTGGIVGGCPVTVIPTVPCRIPLAHSSYGPVNWGGLWYNACPCQVQASRIRLEGPVGRVDEVTIGGVVLDPAAYRVESALWLVRTDGQNWPAATDEGFTVTYLNAWPVDGLGAVAAGLLACEYAKAIVGDKNCALPRNVREINRQGISMVLTAQLFPDGLTGIREVDAYISSYNPHALKVRPSIHIPGSAPRVIS